MAGLAGRRATASCVDLTALEALPGGGEGRRLSATCCCSAWAARASARRCWPRPSAPGRAFPSCWCWTPPTRPDRPRRRPRSIRPAPCSSWPASRERRWSPNCCAHYFFDPPPSALGAEAAGSRFVAITDPGSKLEQTARETGLPPHLPGEPDDRRPLFGAVQLRHGPGRGDRPGRGGHSIAALGPMRWRCGPGAPPQYQPRRAAGGHPGEAARAGRDKLTFLVPPPSPTSAPGWSS